MATPGHHLSNFANFCNFVSILLLFICFSPLYLHTLRMKIHAVNISQWCFSPSPNHHKQEQMPFEDQGRQTSADNSEGISSVGSKDGLLQGVGFVCVSPLPILLTLSNGEWITCNSPRARGEIGKTTQLANWSLIPTVKKWAHLGVPIPATQLIAMMLCC